MDSQCDEGQLPDNRGIKMEPIEVNVNAMAELVEIKPEPDVKVEPDEVETIEYTVTSNQMDGIFIPKVEKIDPNDSDEHKKVDGAGASFNRNNVVVHQSGVRQRDIVGKKSFTIQKSKTSKTKAIKKTKSAPKEPSKTNRRRHNCLECDYVTPNVGNFKRHMLKHTGEKPFACKSCSKRFKNKRYLQSHIKIHVKKGSLNCSICLQIFATKTELVGHESVCKLRWYECHLCKKFSTLYASHLKIHMRVHSGVRPFRCGQCSMKFKQKNALNRHMKVHTNPRPLKFSCSVCARNFFEQSEKVAHQLNCKRRRYECYLCHSYITHHKQKLQYHIRMQHTGERPFKCDLCEKSYPVVSKLNYHKEVNHKQ